ncbi:MAG TPA: sugar-binding protein [Labilithrix sp.]
MGRRIGRAAGLAVVLCACGLRVVGSYVGDVGPEGGAPPPPSPFDAGDDATDAPDADDGGCRPPLLGPDGGRTLNARASALTKTLDGVLADYDVSCPLYVLDRTTAAAAIHLDGGTLDASARVYVEWEPDALWVGVDVTSAPPEASTSDAGYVYYNDSFELYLSGAPDMRTGLYGTFDHHVIVDYASHGVQEVDGGEAPFTDAHSIVKASNDGWTLEAKLAYPTERGTPPFQRGQTLAFDALYNVGVDQQNYLLLARQPHPPCTGCAACTTCNGLEIYDFPAFDPMVFAPLLLR